MGGEMGIPYSNCDEMYQDLMFLRSILSSTANMMKTMALYISCTSASPCEVCDCPVSVIASQEAASGWKNMAHNLQIPIVSLRW